MGRRYDEPVRVRTRPRPLEEDPAGESPERFVWRGRLYLVQEVLASWCERRCWWLLDDAAADVLAAGADRRCWRVRAGRAVEGPSGVYELAMEPVFGRTFEQIVGGVDEGGPRRETDSGANGNWLLTVVGD